MEVSPPPENTTQQQSQEFNLVNAYNAPLWVVTCTDDEENNYFRTGCIVGCVGCASLPSADGGRMVVSISVGHKTTEVVKRTGKFVLNLLCSQQLPLVRHFGFQSGHSVDKFDPKHGAEVFKYWVSKEYNLPIICDTCGWMVLEVVQSVEFPDRIVFICNITKQQVDMKEDDLIQKEVYLYGSSAGTNNALTCKTPLRCYDVFTANRNSTTEKK